MHIKNLKKRTKIVYIICRIKFIGILIIILFKSKAEKDQLFKFKKEVENRKKNSEIKMTVGNLKKKGGGAWHLTY